MAWASVMRAPEAAPYIKAIAIAITTRVFTPATAMPRQRSAKTLSDWNRLLATYSFSVTC
jgi:hypothetical protein